VRNSGEIIDAIHCTELNNRNAPRFARRSFARRVGISLLENIGGGVAEGLLVNSFKDFYDVSKLLGNGGQQGVLSELQKMVKKGWKSKFFDTEKYTRDFERLGKLMWEVYECRGENDMHVVM